MATLMKIHGATATTASTITTPMRTLIGPSHGSCVAF
jgi:hypothetical protein